MRPAEQALLDKIRARLSADELDAFRRQAAAYMRGSIDACEYYTTVDSLGLHSLVPEMAALLPDPGKRDMLLFVYSSVQETAAEAARSNSSSPSSQQTRVQPAASASAADEFPELNGRRGVNNSKNTKKVPKFERLRLTGGDPAATQNFLDTNGGTEVKPQNAWTQGKPSISSGGEGSAQPRGQWSQQGKVATEWRNINDAWAKK